MVATKAKIAAAHIVEGEPDRATIQANDLVVDVIANDDGTVYLEFYGYSSGGAIELVHLPSLGTVGNPSMTIRRVDRFVGSRSSVER